MDLTPIDVEQKAFTQALRGYQMDEVDDFLDEIVRSLRAYDQRLRDAQEKIRALETDASSRGGDETTISRAILVAQRSADSLLADAKVEAERIRQTAVAETESLTANRDRERIRLQAEVDGMQDRVLSLRQALTVLASAVGGQVGAMEAEITQTGTRIRQEPKEQAETTEQVPVEPSIQEDSAPMFHALEMEASAKVDSPDAQPQEGLQSIAPSESADADDDFSQEEVVSPRISARPWERG